MNFVRGENTFPFERKLMSTDKILRIWLCSLLPFFVNHVKTNFAKHWCFWIQNSTDNSRQTIFSVKMQSTRKTNRISQFHECLENTTKCFLKTTMDFVIGIGSKEPKHRFSWGLILDKLQLRSILYPLSQQKV